MEKIINQDVFSKIFYDAEYDSNSYQNLVEKLYLKCIAFQIYLDDYKNQYKDFKSEFTDFECIERLSLYLLSNYTRSINNNYSIDLIHKAMNVSAVAFEKLGYYVGTLNTDEIPEQNIKLKQLRYYFRSAVAYTLAENAPNSCVIARKMNEVLNIISQDNNIEYYELINVSTFVLMRRFPREIIGVKDKNLVEIISCLHNLFQTGNRNFYQKCLDKINDLNKHYSNNSISFKHYALKLLEQIIKKIWSNSIWTLLSHSFNNNYLQSLIRSNPPVYELWPNQKKIVSDKNSFLNNDNIKRAIINFNTSGGKSLIAELAIVKELNLRPDKKCLFIVPTNALVHEVTKRFITKLGRLNFTINNITSDFETNNVNEIKDNIIVTTPEKLQTIIRTNYENSFLNSVSLIVFDEFHKIEDRERGWTIESSIWFLISHHIYKNIKIIILSAIMDNSDVVLNWIDDNNNFSDEIYSDSWKPSQTLKAIATEKFDFKKITKDDELYTLWKDDNYELYTANCALTYYHCKETIFNEIYNFSIFSYPKYRFKIKNGNGRYAFDRQKEIKRREFATGVAQQLSKIGTTLILLNTKVQCENFISEYEPYFNITVPDDEKIQFLIKYISKRFDENHLLVKGLKHRVIFHYGSLPDDIREALEEVINMGLIRLIVSTTTLLEGVNFPIQNFIYYGKQYETERTISIGDLKNISGRAGRAHKYTFGQIVFIKNNSKKIEDDTFFEKDKFFYDDYKNNIYSSFKENDEFLKKIEEYFKLSENDYNDFLINLSIMPFFQSLLLLYNSNITEETIGDALAKTYFSKFIPQEKKDSIVKFSKGVYKFFNTFDKNLLLDVQKSGLSLSGYKTIGKIAQDICTRISGDINIINDFSCLITKEIFSQIIKIDEFVPYEVKKSTGRSTIVYIDDYEMLIDWFVNKKSIPILTDKYFNKVNINLRTNRVTEYIKDFYEFKLPWAFNIIFTLIVNNSTLTEIDHKEVLKRYPKFIRYGLNTPLESLLTELGFNSRETIIDLANLLQTKDAQVIKDNVIEILLSLSNQDYNNFTEYEIRKINQIINNINKKINVIEEHGIIFNIAATKYYFCKLKNIAKIFQKVSSDTILFKREKNNYYDEHAVKVELKDGTVLGYIPKIYNEEISYYLNLEYKLNIELIEKEIIDINSFIKITIKLNIVNDIKGEVDPENRTVV